MAANARELGHTQESILWDISLSSALQLLHALAAKNGVEFEWLNQHGPTQKILDEVDRLENLTEIKQIEIDDWNNYNARI